MGEQRMDLSQMPLSTESELCQRLFDTPMEIVCICRDGHVSAINSWGRQVLGRTDIVGAPFLDLLHPEYRVAMDGVEDLANAEGTLLKLLRHDGQDVNVEVTAFPIGGAVGDTYLVKMRDVSERTSFAQDAVKSEQRFRRLVDLTADLVCVLAKGRIEFINPAGSRMLGANGEFPLIGRSIADFLHPDYAGISLAALADEPVPVPLLFRTVDGQGLDLTVVLRPFGMGAADTFVLCAHDTTALHRSAEALRRREQRLQGILDTVPDGILIADARGIVLSVNPAAAQLFACLPGQAVGRPLATFIPELACLAGDDLIDRLLERSRTAFLANNREMLGRRLDNSSISIEISVAALSETVERQIIIVVRDISERKQAEERIRYQATHDILTDLPNRHQFIAHLDIVREACIRRRRKGALLVLDVDGLKLINDSAGYAVGDKALVALARRMLGCLNSENYLARLGGNEFAVIVPEIPADYEAAILAKRLIDVIEQPIDVDGFELSVTASVGIVVLPNGGDDDVNTLLKNAGAALSQARDAERGSLAFFSADINDMLSERMSLRSGLGKAQEHDEFRLVYQPKVDLATGRICGVEALLRWNCPDRGPVPPTKFIPILEETSLIGSVGRWVLETACDQQREWIERGFGDMRTAVNLSVRQLRPGLVPMVESVLAKTRLDPRHLEIEITESLLLRDTDNAIAMLRALSDMGISLSIDDFGTGYSSLSYLTRLPLSTIKIDRSFIIDLTINPDAAEIVRTIVTMAHSLRRRTIAEGVETQDQLAILRGFGCDEIQGYLFSRPVPGDAVLDMLIAESAPDAMPRASMRALSP